MNYAQPNSLDEALSLLATDSWAILAGGTDFYPASPEGLASRNVIDIHALHELGKISTDEAHLRIGAGVTWADLTSADLPPAFEGLQLAAREIGSVQVQNRATLVGNLCNASPAADGVPPLLTLNAEVELVSQSGKRALPLQQFTLGNRQTARRSDEIVTAILVPHHALSGQSHFVKLGARKYLVISITMAAGRLVCDAQGVIAEAALSVGSCSLVAQRLEELEIALIGQTVSTDLGSVVCTEHLASLSPIDDVRSTAQYRRSASLELVRRCLDSLGRKSA